jgi:hypothetical protein
MDLLGQLDTYLAGPVDVTTFAEGKEYCNKVLYPRQRLLLKLFFLEDLTDFEERILDHWIAGGSQAGGEGEMDISPHIRERIQYLKDHGYKHFHEVVLVGGRRGAKGFITALAMTKLMYDTMLLKDPGQHYQIDRDKQIYYSVVAASLDQAKERQYADLRNTVNSCTAINRNMSKAQETEFSVMTEYNIRMAEQWKRQGRKVDADMATLRGNALPANSRTIRGLTMMAICFDEFAHFQQGENDQSDEEVYSAAVPSLAQFGRDSMLFCNSSPYSKVGTFYERYETGMAEDNGGPDNPAVLSIRFPSWAGFDGWWEEPRPEIRKALMVSPDWDPEQKKEDGSYFYCEDDRALIVAQRSEEASNPPKYRVEYRSHFAEVVDAYLDPLMVDRMFLGRPYEYLNDMEEIQRGYAPMEMNWEGSTYEHDYRAHIDPSSTTAGFGFALGHVEVYELSKRIEQHVVFDVVQRWDPKRFKDSVIDWEPILNELLRYCEIFRPRSLTFDQHQTLYPMSWLRKQLRARGVGTRVFEKTPNIQSNWNRAEVFRTGLYRDLIHAPTIDNEDCNYASLELKYLQEIKTSRIPRVEKQDVGPVQTKDVADAVMEVVEACIGNAIAIQDRDSLGDTPIRVAAPGGYGIGGGSHGSSDPMRPRGARGDMAEHYPRRGSERFQSSPTRRPVGGRPIPRQLPHRRLPGW